MMSLSRANCGIPNITGISDHYFLREGKFHGIKIIKSTRIEHAQLNNVTGLANNNTAAPTHLISELTTKLDELIAVAEHSASYPEIIRLTESLRRAKAEIAQVSIARVKTEVASPATPRLSKADLVKFQTRAKKHPWTGDRTISPSQFIETHFRKWLGHGLARKHLNAVLELKGLAEAYSSEVRADRHPERRLAGLIVEPQKLPADAPKHFRLRSEKRVAELSQEKVEKRRAQEAAKKARYRAKLSSRPRTRDLTDKPEVR
jgi:hypothetical protein